MAEELFAALDASVKQSNGNLYRQSAGAHNPGSPRSSANRGANRDQKGVTFRPDTGVTAVTASGCLSLISTTIHISFH
jgi:hypothetical protein